ncbi:MAG: hypothetical protein HQL32_17970 [Planctomycetes bacterium]|nr:hypothetical protein [Planctomycetota bacterium]
MPEFRKDQQNAFLAYLARMVEHNKKHFSLLDNTPDLLLRDVVCSSPAEGLTALGDIFGLDTNFIDLIRREKAYDQSMKNWKSYLQWQKSRNEKRYLMEEKAGYDTKNIQHCVRLLYQAKEILEVGAFTVNRDGIDGDLLRDIKNGRYTYDDIMELTNDLRKKITEAAQKSSLPENPDEDSLKGVYEDVLRKLSFI